MKPTTLSLVLGLVALLAGGLAPLDAQEARFFRVAGPGPSTITAFRPDGTLIWSNALPGTNYMVQTVAALPGGTNWVDYVQLAVVTSLNTNQIVAFNPPAGMVFIPAGSFTMGDNLDGESDALPLQPVYVSALYMDQYVVTEALWAQVYNWATNHGYSFDNVSSAFNEYNDEKGPNYPVVDVNWYDVVKWCNARSEMAGKAQAYYTDASQTVVYRTGDLDLSNATVNWNAGYRLPTEAEWEKAARGGLSGQRFPSGNTISESQANYVADPLVLDPQNGLACDVSAYIGSNTNFDTGEHPFTSPAGDFAPNGYGLCDMAGNVFQRTWDWYGGYGSTAQTDPRGPSSGSDRVSRGGSWNDHASYCRSADREYEFPAHYFGNNLGFRSVLPPGP